MRGEGPALSNVEGTIQFDEPYRSNYLDEPNTPLFPFGYGLSYTTFAYSDLKVETPMVGIEDTLVVTAVVRDTGDRAGEEYDRRQSRHSTNDWYDRRQTMTFSELIQKRYSVRGYRPDPVEEEVLQQVLEAARLAPTAGNRQRFRLIVVHTEDREEELRRIYDRDWFVQPPLVICACRFPMDPARKLKDYTDVDIGIVVDHLTLAAAELGLGTCWIGAFDPAAAREVLGLPDEVEPVVFTPLGYPADPPRSKQRKPLSELVRYEHW